MRTSIYFHLPFPPGNLDMQYSIAFYIHHHGSGHIMRSIAIARELKNCNIYFLGSDLSAYSGIIPHWINCLQLPMDTPMDGEYLPDYQPAAVALHYAPIGVEGQRKRVAMITDFLSTVNPCLLVVDVSVEIAMLARLCGIPTIVVRQHGNRIDLPHKVAYRNAIGLLAPYGKELQSSDPKWMLDKTFFTGGFSRFSPQKDTSNIEDKTVAVLIGSGGSSIDEGFVYHLAGTCVEWTFHIIGSGIPQENNLNYKNLFIHGNIENPLPLLTSCRLIIGNSGHNTVMEAASLDKRFITIPEPRPFQEQLSKAEILQMNNLATVVLPENMQKINWNLLLQETTKSTPEWGETISASAISKAAQYIQQSAKRIWS